MNSIRVLCSLGVALAFTGVAAAQDEMPKGELGLGWSMLRLNSARDIPSFSANGGVGGFQYNFGEHFGMVAELGGYHNGNIHNVDRVVVVNPLVNAEPFNAHLDNTWATYLFGPRVSLTKRSSRIVPSLEVLLGGAYVSGSIRCLTGTRYAPHGSTKLLRDGGRRIAGHRLESSSSPCGPFQADYLLTRLESRNLGGFQTFNQNNFRVSAGLVFRFGGGEHFAPPAPPRLL